MFLKFWKEHYHNTTKNDPKLHYCSTGKTTQTNYKTFEKDFERNFNGRKWYKKVANGPKTKKNITVTKLDLCDDIGERCHYKRGTWNSDKATCHCKAEWKGIACNISTTGGGSSGTGSGGSSSSGAGSGGASDTGTFSILAIGKNDIKCCPTIKQSFVQGATMDTYYEEMTCFNNANARKLHAGGGKCTEDGTGPNSLTMDVQTCSGRGKCMSNEDPNQDGKTNNQCGCERCLLCKMSTCTYFFFSSSSGDFCQCYGTPAEGAKWNDLWDDNSINQKWLCGVDHLTGKNLMMDCNCECVLEQTDAAGVAISQCADQGGFSGDTERPCTEVSF